jgi:type IV secretion system protein VirB10
MMEPDNHRTGMMPLFLKKTLLSPVLIGGTIGVVGVATLPMWHIRTPNPSEMAARQFASMQTNAASAASTFDKPEAPDPSPTPFPVHTIAPAQVVAQLVHPTTTVTQSTAVAAAVVPAPSPVATPEPLPPADTHGTWSTSSADAQAGSPAPAQRPVLVADRQAVSGIGYVPATSRYELQQGAVIHARFTMHVDAEHQGQVEATVVEPVYASAHPQTEIIPAGTQCVGSYGSTSSGDTRLLISWTRLNLPNGQKFAFDEPATDEMGNTGASGQVNTHAGKAFGQAALYTLLSGIGNAFSRSNTVVLGGGSMTQGLVQQPQAIKPDVYIQEGSRVDIVASRDLPFDAYSEAGQ